MIDQKLIIVNFIQARYGMSYLSAYDFITDNPKLALRIYNKFKGRQNKIDKDIIKLKNKKLNNTNK